MKDNMILEIFLDAVKADIHGFKSFLDDNKEVTKKDVELFLDDLEIHIRDLEEDLNVDKNCN